MKTKNTFGIHFIIRVSNSNKTVPSLIYARVTVNGQRTEISLKLKISPTSWDNIKGKAKGKSEDTVRINAHIERVRSLITDAYHQLVQQKRVVSIGAVKNIFLGHDDTESSLLKLIDYHREIATSKLAYGTLKNYFSTEKYLKSYLRKVHNRTDIYLSEINYKFIFDFENFLRNCKPIHKHQPLNNNGIMKHIERFKKLINLAITMEWMEKDPFTKYKLQFEKTERGHLTKSELEILVNKNFAIERLQAVLDMFLFSCYTGLAYIDIFHLAPQNIAKGSDGKDWIISSREKTKIPVRVPLLPEALELIEKYKDHPVAFAKGKLFPVISNQRMNGYLKEIAIICDIDKNLSFHLARHTFATTITLNNGVPIESVSKMLGHTAIKTTQIYAKVLEHKLGEDMDNLRERRRIQENHKYNFEESN
ncbi:hypothetical protein HMPREF9714_01128 [Myroides odoratimimus CCUG 12901]|uniref:site-specific integrase n=1 Tax=Myroides odoratimimus TaxID=76832 RepID=UPI00024616DA|nr:site-specific integrase [Myroides odoratimimus]EHO12758.1 hypothetical protein HMPREF9714_01128 [Myroides odoratimimus CCUG 12901]SHM76003.1 Site-specific recombinase XerD [Myroides odoratimimus subsp. xuanwuensis]